YTDSSTRIRRLHASFYLLFLHATAPTALSTLSLHDALPISGSAELLGAGRVEQRFHDGLGAADIARRRGAHLHEVLPHRVLVIQDRKSTRLNSSHQIISYAVFCLKKTSQPQCVDVISSAPTA